jgi:hypothetical protein
MERELKADIRPSTKLDIEKLKRLGYSAGVDDVSDEEQRPR